MTRITTAIITMMIRTTRYTGQNAAMLAAAATQAAAAHEYNAITMTTPTMTASTIKFAWSKAIATWLFWKKLTIADPIAIIVMRALTKAPTAFCKAPDFTSH